MNGIQLLWFKRDLRVHDHTALVAASRRGFVLPLDIIEPDDWAQPASNPAHV